jgi:hypothetical protein
MKLNSYFLYLERSNQLSHTSILYALTILIGSQFIFFNLHYIIGGILTIISLMTIAIQVIFQTFEKIYLDKKNIFQLNKIWNIHFWINKIMLLINFPFLIWVVVLMFIK